MSLATHLDSIKSLAWAVVQKGKIDVIVLEADKARDARDWPLAAKGYAAAIEAGAIQSGLKVQLGHALKEMGDFDRAERIYREFLQDHAENADIHLQLGHLFNRKGDYRAALTFYEQAFDLAPDSTEVALHVDLAQAKVGRIDIVRKRDAAMVLVADRKWQAARQILEELVETDGEQDLIGVLANVTKESGQLEEAASLYDRYLRYAESRSDATLVEDCHLQRGHLHKITGEYSLALTDFLSARKSRRAHGDYDGDGADVEREIVACLRDIYPCFVFPG